MLTIILIFVVLSATIQAESDFQLPDLIKPEGYRLILALPNDLTDTDYSGILLFNFVTLEVIDEFYLHSHGHNDFEVSIFNSSEELVATTRSITNENEHVIKIQLTAQLEANQEFAMLMTFKGIISDTPSGLYRTKYRDENDEYVWQIATNFQSFRAHYAFPCYDNQTYRTNFVLSIQHHPDCISIFNANESQRRTIAGGRVQTDFQEVTSIAPNSLAFFVSDFHNKTANKNGIEHQMTMRETEIDNMEKFFDSLESTVEAVESFMNYNLTNDLINHVALPDYESDIGSFYRFNYYREHLIRFNPAISPQTKELSIRRAITAGLVSQFLGSIVSFASHNDAWIFNGIIKFLEYYITTSDVDNDDFRWQEVLFINDILQPSMAVRDIESSMQDATEKAACTFYMIYSAIGEEAFTVAMRRLISENSYKSITTDTFYEILQESYEQFNSNDDDDYADLRRVIEDFMVNEQPLVVTANVVDGNFLQIIKPDDITMPVNYLTSNMNGVAAETMWLVRGFETQMIEPHDWILLNVNRLGFYRVNYNNANWMSLTRALNDDRDAFNDTTISQLIDDSLNLARDGLLSFTIVLDLLEVMRDETSFIVWSAAGANLLELNNRLRDLDIHQDFMEFVQKISNNYMAALGFDDPNDESLMNKLSRIQMIDLTCQMRSDECLSVMHSRLVSYLNQSNNNGADDVSGEELLPVNLEASIFCYGLMASADGNFEGPSDESDFNRVLLKLNASTDSEYRLKIIDALGCHADVDALLMFLHTTLEDSDDNHIRYDASEHFHIVKSIYSRSNQGIEAVLTFLHASFENLVKNSQNDQIIEKTLNGIAPKIFDAELFEMFKDTLRHLEIDDILSEHLTKIVNKNLEWRQSKAIDEIREWFRVDETTTIITSTEESVTDETTVTDDNEETTSISLSSTTTDESVTEETTVTDDNEETTSIFLSTTTEEISTDDNENTSSTSSSTTPTTSTTVESTTTELSTTPLSSSTTTEQSTTPGSASNMKISILMLSIMSFVLILN